MAKIDPKDVMALRRKSGLGLMECKAALEKANGDMVIAEDNMRKDGLSKMDGRIDRNASDGCIAVAATDDLSKCAIVEINSETDFTAKNDSFVAMAIEIAQLALRQPAGDVEKTNEMQNRVDDLRVTTKENVTWRRGIVLDGGQIGTYVHHDRKTGVAVQVDRKIDNTVLRKLCLHVASADPAPLCVNVAGVPEDVLAKEREIAMAQATKSSKPDAIVEKMVDGKIAKFLDGVVLLRQPFVMDGNNRIMDLLPNGVTIQRFVKYTVGR
ncbi:MAG: translation elongation factor Ts [Pirellulaceae bacterium]